YDVRYNGTSNRIILAGGVSGGVYKSTDDGATWVRTSPTGEHFSCTSIAQDTRSGFEDTWYYGVGEASGNSAGGTGAFYAGNGVYKSTDNGSTWSRLTTSNSTALETFSVAQDFINKIIVDPTNGNVYIACPATIRRSVDGGTTWATVLSGTLVSSGQFTDIVVSSTGRFYAGFGGTNSVGADGVWTSTTGASASWTRIAGPGGTPAGWNANGAYGRVVLAIPPSDETLLYALYYIGATSSCVGPFPEAEFFRWDNVGATWTDLSATLPDEAGCLAGNDPFAVQGGYDLVVAVKPDAAGTLFIGGTNAYRSTDAGLSWTRIGGYASPASYALYASSHPDVHAFAFQPGSPLIMLCGNDGGIQRTTDCTAGTVAWTQINTGYRTYQYYYVTLDPRTANEKVLGGAQDNGSTRNTGGSGTSFEMVYGGDGVSVGLSGASEIEYVGSQSGYINRRPAADGLGFTTDITPTGEGGTGLFVTYHKLDADNTEILYYANDNALYRTTTASSVTSGSWTSMTGVATAIGAAFDITAMATTRGAYSASSNLFIGTSNGRVFRLDDPSVAGAATPPIEISLGAGFPAVGSGYISSIAVNPRNDDTVLVTFSNYGVVSVFWAGTANTSATPSWTAVEGALTLPSYRSCAIHAVPNSPEVQYYVGTSVGLYRSGTSFPGTPGWIQEGPSDIGNAVISSLAFRPVDGKLLVGTHGYGMWYTMLSLVPLPVELTEFKGSLQNNKTALLQWTTSAEYNSKHFELEKSFDGINFRKIATIAAAGNSSAVINYRYTDREPLTEKNYYRLISVDIDNDRKLSNIVLIKVPDARQDILVMGNPFTNNLLVRFVRSPGSKGELRLTDMAGRLMLKQAFGPGEQQVSFQIPPGKLSKGVYLLEAIVNGSRFTARVLKE
ncbi:MAG TPA: T9SS type A sorting domain-containing protein, partial [Chitinophagaceae bacterium]|nr:T9SS type A sorting domain-containing protein [Chitinophagaceae bacterium]